MPNLFWSPVEIETYNTIVAAHYARNSARTFVADNTRISHPTEH